MNWDTGHGLSIYETVKPASAVTHFLQWSHLYPTKPHLLTVPLSLGAIFFQTTTKEKTTCNPGQALRAILLTQGAWTPSTQNHAETCACETSLSPSRPRQLAHTAAETMGTALAVLEKQQIRWRPLLCTWCQAIRKQWVLPNAIMTSTSTLSFKMLHPLKYRKYHSVILMSTPVS